MKRIMINKLNNYIGEKVKIEGWVHRVRCLKTITFLILRDRTGLVQCISDNNLMDIASIKLESVISITGEVKESNNKLNNFEIEVSSLDIISSCKNELPIEINKDELNKIGIEGKKYLELLDIKLPKIVDSISRMRFSEALYILRKEYNKTDLDGDLDPEAEKLICEYTKEKLGCEFIFLTHYPRRKRPMYTMAYGEVETSSFDLLFRGIEITTGGQRIHDYDMLIDNIKYKGLNPENYESYT